MSRYAGVWVALKLVADMLDGSASVAVSDDRVRLVQPTDFAMPEGGLGIRWPDPPLVQEERLHRHKLYAALAFARANGLDRVVLDSPAPRIGIVTGGKTYPDVRQALDDLGIDEAFASEIGLRVYKVGMTWPLEREGARRFAEGLDEVVVIEEKRAIIENQFKEQLYNWDAAKRPRVIGKFDEDRNLILPSFDELTPARIARVIAHRLAPFVTTDRIRDRLAFLEAKERQLTAEPAPISRIPYFCAGCPHNTSTKVPEGSRALAGIGCHYMAIWMDRSTATFTQMGAEGATWIGQAPFTETRHVFQNLGDGTYVHSGLLAIRATVAAGVNITYKILYNDAVAMTGGQPVEGHPSVAQISHQLYGEGIRRIAVVTDEPGKYPSDAGFAAGVTIHHRRELDALQRKLREIKGTSVLLYDQMCATEKRRRRKRGLIEDPDVRVVINEEVCEGCGDCGRVSNCLAIVPVETEFGRKRQIDQSACNKDLSCRDGFCPSFVTVRGARPRRRAVAGLDGLGPEGLPEPALPALDEPYGILVTGVGGTGVVTVGAILGMAAHLEGKGVGVLDQTGLAQKYGAVVSHLRIAASPEAIHAVKIAAGGARLMLGCDLVVAAGFDALAKLRDGATTAVVNAHESPTGDFTRKPDLEFPAGRLKRRIVEAVGDARAHFLDATAIATALFGDALATNFFMVGLAYQMGLVPVGSAAILRAIELNGMAVAMNAAAFAAGRHTALDPARVAGLVERARPVPAHRRLAATPEEAFERRAGHLTAYQNRGLAERYRAFVARAQAAEAAQAGGLTGLAEAVARGYHKVLAYKDEYEVARLYVEGAFAAQIAAAYEGRPRLEVHLAPPILAERDPLTGAPRKRAFGPWVFVLFRLLARLKGLRGTVLDPFGRSPERRAERALIATYEAAVTEARDRLDHDNHDLVVEIARFVEPIRGFGHVKDANRAAALARLDELMTLLRAGPRTRRAAE
jgi:indolepyruvate ferredoxin oxidoreductase